MSRSSSAVRRSTLRSADGRPERLDRLRLLESWLDEHRQRHVVDIERGRRRSIARSSSMTAFFAIWNSHVVKADVAGEAGQALEDLEKDILRQVLGEATVVDEAVDVREDEALVGVNDDGERSLVAALAPGAARLRRAA